MEHGILSSAAAARRLGTLLCMQFLLAHGPNLNLLGARDPAVYGTLTLADLEALTREAGAGLGVDVESFQTNHEGALIDRLHSVRGSFDGIILNAGAWTHSSYALRDAIEAIGVPTVEIHLSNVKEREAFRRHSVIEEVCVYSIYGRGEQGYPHAVQRLHSLLTAPPAVHRYGPHPDQLGELRIPSGPGPFAVVALLHGGFWRHQWQRDTLDPLAVDLTAHGFATWNIEYRRTGLGGGGATTMADVAAALTHLDNLDAPLDLGRVAAVGHSAGGQLALWAAGTPETGQTLRLVVSIAGVTDLVAARSEQVGEGAVDAFMGSADLEPFSPRHLLPLGTRSLCVHGTADDLVPIHFSADFVDAAVAAGDRSDLVAVEGADHFDPIDPRSTAWETTRTRIKEALTA